MKRNFFSTLLLIFCSWIVSCASREPGLKNSKAHGAQDLDQLYDGGETLTVKPLQSSVEVKPSPTPTPWPKQYVPCSKELKAERIRKAMASDFLFTGRKTTLLYVANGSGGSEYVPDSTMSKVVKNNRMSTAFIYKMDGLTYSGSVEFDENSCSVGAINGGFEMLPIK